MNRSGVRASTVRYEDSNHCRIGGGDSSTARARAPASAMSNAASATTLGTPAAGRIGSRRQQVTAAVELRRRAADAIVLRHIPIAVDLPVRRVLELHVR